MYGHTRNNIYIYAYKRLVAAHVKFKLHYALLRAILNFTHCPTLKNNRYITQKCALSALEAPF